MDRLVRVFYGGRVRENGEFEEMEEKVVVFKEPPSYADLAFHVKTDVSYFVGREEPRFRGRFDGGSLEPTMGFWI